MSRRTAVEGYYQHLSHGQILDHGRNLGPDEPGVRFLYRFNLDAAD